MCGNRLRDRAPSAKLRDRLGIENISTVLQRNRLRWFGHVQRKPDNDWIEVYGVSYIERLKCKGRLKVTCMKVISRDLRDLGVCREDAAD